MITSAITTRTECQRCRGVKTFVLATAFNSDGSFRFLCAACDRVERWTNQRRLFDEAPRPAPVLEVEEPEPEPVHTVSRLQMALF
jgi:hypothetical protein